MLQVSRCLHGREENFQQQALLYILDMGFTLYSLGGGPLPLPCTGPGYHSSPMCDRKTFIINTLFISVLSYLAHRTPVDHW